MIVLYIALVALIFWYFFVTKIPKGFPNGPRFRLPILGHHYLIGKDPRKSFHKLRQQYGDIFYFESGPFQTIVVSDLKIIEEMLNQDVFSGRWNLDEAFKEGLNSRIRGGHGMHGLIQSNGQEWKEQRRFALRHLRDFGFGKSSMESIVIEEFQELAADMREKANNGEEIAVKEYFNINVLNILWRIVTGNRLDRNDPEQATIMHRLSDMFSNFGTGSILVMLSLCIIPKFLRKYDPIMNKFAATFHDIFAIFNKEYEDHEKTFNEDNLRDFTDAYIKERKRVTEAKETQSSFYGESGHWNFINCFFDLFLAGSETTSTSLSFTLLYLLHFPSIQKKLQDEIDSVVGRNRLPSGEDRARLPYVEAFISELQRHATIAPLSVQHVPTEDITYKGYFFPKNTMITPNIGEVMNDPAYFKNPDKFSPERFLNESGQYQSNPALINFGIGKRECLGKSLAKMELFLLTTCLIHQFSFEPASGGVPDLRDAKLGVTRTPAKFNVNVKIRA